MEFTIVNGQIFTPGLAIVDAPQPYTPLGGDTLHIALDVSGNGQLPLTSDDDAPTRFHEITLFLTSEEKERNLTISNGTSISSSSDSPAYVGPILDLEPNSTVKHVNWVWPDCFVGDEDDNRDKDSARGNYNISMHQSFRWNGTEYYTVFELPISVSNGIEASRERVECGLLENEFAVGPSVASNQSLPGQPWVGDGIQTGSEGEEGGGGALGGGGGGRVLRWVVFGLVVGMVL
ncbi:uncharacterized protein BJX67DRAFT_389678 [Aspergillus lucknowensis]|uniref:Uncharacterized protein n=1 Tax=Aspergillus lucknowensis TaxID=176173 RepID=A0ABR4LJQ0_9EURO